MSIEPTEKTPTPSMPRLFLFEPSWQIGRKNGSDREFCYTIAPGQDFYHRLLDGEIFVYRADEKVCLPCAARRGLLNVDPKVLREPAAGMNLAIDELLNGFDVVLREESEPST